jgi:hypothetical protein
VRLPCFSHSELREGESSKATSSSGCHIAKRQDVQRSESRLRSILSALLCKSARRNLLCKFDSPFVSDVPLVPPPIIKIVGFVLFNNFLCGGSIRGFCSAVHLQRQCVCREIPAAQYFVESEIVGCKWVCIQVRKKTPMDAHLKIYHADRVLRTFINGSRMSFRKTITYFREFLERQIQILQVRRFST